MSRSDWADLGLRVLTEEGPAGLTVARLCRHAGRTRGSLYHHFADHDALLYGVLARWVEEHTDRLIEQAKSGRQLNALASALDFRVEQAVRRLATRHPQLHEVIADVDKRRIGFLAELHRSRGSSQPRELAEIEYAAFLGFQQLDLSRRRLTNLYARFERLIEKA